MIANLEASLSFIPSSYTHLPHPSSLGLGRAAPEMSHAVLAVCWSLHQTAAHIYVS